MEANTGHLHRFSPSEIEEAVAPMLLQPLTSDTYSLLAGYLRLLTRWNERMNLTAVRDPDILVRLHLAECLRAAQRIPEEVETVLDFGSGAGFPGIAIQIARPELRVTLAESQKKKASFLREVVRELGLTGASIHAARVEEMPSAWVFDLVTLRAVDKMAEAMQAALPRIRPVPRSRPGWCMVLTSRSEVASIVAAPGGASASAVPVSIDWLAPEPILSTNQRVIALGSRVT